MSALFCLRPVLGAATVGIGLICNSVKIAAGTGGFSSESVHRTSTASCLCNDVESCKV